MSNVNRNYSSREEQVRDQLTVDVVINRIQEIYHTQYDPDNQAFDAWDQFLACEAIAESTPIETNQANGSDNASVSENVSEPQLTESKQKVIFELTPNKQDTITKLKQCNYLTPPLQVAGYLEELFKEWKSAPSHWLYIAQHWHPRAIAWTLNDIVKRLSTGQETIQNPSAYFTKLIKHRKKRKKT